MANTVSVQLSVWASGTVIQPTIIPLSTVESPQTTPGYKAYSLEPTGVATQITDIALGSLCVVQNPPGIGQQSFAFGVGSSVLYLPMVAAGDVAIFRVSTYTGTPFWWTSLGTGGSPCQLIVFNP